MITFFFWKIFGGVADKQNDSKFLSGLKRCISSEFSARPPAKSPLTQPITPLKFDQSAQDDPTNSLDTDFLNVEPSLGGPVPFWRFTMWLEELGFGFSYVWGIVVSCHCTNIRICCSERKWHSFDSSDHYASVPNQRSWKTNWGEVVIHRNIKECSVDWRKPHQIAEMPRKKLPCVDFEDSSDFGWMIHHQPTDISEFDAVHQKGMDL